MLNARQMAELQRQSAERQELVEAWDRLCADDPELAWLDLQERTAAMAHEKTAAHLEFQESCRDADAEIQSYGFANLEGYCDYIERVQSWPSLLRRMHGQYRKLLTALRRHMPGELLSVEHG